MAKIAHLKVTCPQCGKYTSIYVVEDGGTGAKVKCEYCKQVFEFGAGIAYEPIAYVQSMPNWAVIKKDDKIFSQAAVCKKCGKGYNESDLSFARISQKVTSESDNPLLSAILAKGIQTQVSITLSKCSSCGKIACSECALEGSGITGKRCPFCKTDYTIYSHIEPTSENISSDGDADDGQAEPSDGGSNEKQAKSIGGFFRRLFGG